MTDQHDQRLRVAAARADFLEFGSQGAAGVTDVVAASWQRSKSAGVDADVYHVDYHQDIDFDSRLVRCARPVIERLTSDMSEVPVAIALTDSRARIVDRRDCSTAVGRLLDRVDFLPGFSFQEDGVGTNGIGTVFESGLPVSVVGPEHFNQQLVQFACTGAPILDPLTGRVEGVLDVSLLAESWTPLIHALTRSAAADIGRNLLYDRSQAQRALFEMYLKADSRQHQAVMAVGSSVMVNRRAQALLSPEEQRAIHQHAQYLTAHRDRISENVTLESGRTIALRAARVLCGNDTAGILLLLDEHSTSRISDSVATPSDHTLSMVSAPDPRTSSLVTGVLSPPPPIVDGRCPAWVSACAELSDALTRRDNVLVTGESGTGRFTVLVELFHRIHQQGRSLSIGAEQITRDVGIGSVQVPANAGPTLIVLRNLDLLSTDGVDAVNALLDSIDPMEETCIVAATVATDALDSDLPYQDVLAHFGHSTALPPIRYRSIDLPHLVARTLEDIAPGRRTRLSPNALRTISSYSWPRNMTQLREALTSALHKRPVGEIQVEDLPGYCRTSSTRTLTALETTERDAMIKALDESNGNRLHAAAALGMSRSSLYRKLRIYAITDAATPRR